MEFNRRTLLWGAAALTIPVTTSACTRKGGTGTAAAAKVLTLAPNMDNNSFDPTQLNLGNQSQYWGPVYDTLLTRDADHKLVANLAESWEYDATMTKLTMKLKSGVKFTDGTALDAEAVKANFANLAAGTGQNAFMAKPVKEVQVTSPTELTITLNAPDPGFEEYLASVGGAMASPKSFKAADVANNPVGVGPYTLDKANTVVGSTYTYQKVKDYWNAAKYPYDTIVLKPMTDLTARLNALKSGQVNGTIADISSVKEAESSKLTVNASSVNWAGLLIMDRAGATVPALKDLRVRRAINHAFDTESILKSIDQGRGKRTTQIFNPSSPAYDTSLDTRYPFDIDKAKQLMSEAGAGAGFAISMPRSPGGFEAYYAIIEKTLGQLNIKVNWVQVPVANIVPETISGKYPITFMTLGSQGAWQDIQKAVIKNAPWNPFKVGDSTLQGLLDDAQKANKANQQKAMQAVSSWLVDQAWFCPWYRPDNIYLTDAKTAVVTDPYVVAAPYGSFKPKG